jgi:hypothetical protein
MLAAVFFAAGSTLSVPISLMRPTAEYIPINKAGFCRVRSTESMYGFAASLMKANTDLRGQRRARLITRIVTFCRRLARQWRPQ